MPTDNAPDTTPPGQAELEPQPTAPVPPLWLPAMGYGLLAVGVTALVCRFVMIPFDVALPSWQQALLNGGPIGLAVVGVQQLLAARRQGCPTLLAHVVPVVALCVALTVAAFWVLAPRGLDAATEPLAEVQLPRLRVSLPAWSVEESGDAFANGAYVVAPPSGNGRFIEVRWALATPMGVDEVETMFAGFAKASVEERRDLVVNQHPAREMRFTSDEGGKRFIATHWYCQDDQRSVSVLTFLSLEADALTTLHRRIVDTARCHDGPANAIPPTVHPEVTPPPGFTRAEHPTALVFVSQDGNAFYDFSPPFDDVAMPAKVAEVPGLAATLMQTELGLAQLELVVSDQAFKGHDGSQRRLYEATSSDEVGALRVFMVLWTCQELGNAFVGFYLGPAESDRGEALDGLAAASCPAR